MTGVVFVYVNHPSDAEASALGRSLVEAGLAAAVNVIAGAETIYRWQGVVETGREAIMIVKTRSSLVDEVTAFVRERHPYDCPGIAAVPVVAGSADYLAWVGEVTRDD